jgi:hypothetical protein
VSVYGVNHSNLSERGEQVSVYRVYCPNLSERGIGECVWGQCLREGNRWVCMGLITLREGNRCPNLSEKGGGVCMPILGWHAWGYS